MSTYIHLIDYAGNTRIVNVSQISAVNVTATADYIYFIEGEESFSSTITSNAERAHLLDILSFSQFYDARVNNLGWILNLAWIKEVDYTPETSTQIEEALVHYTLDGKTFTFIGGQVPPFIAALEAYVGNAGGEGGTGGSGAKGNTGNTGPIGATGLAGRTGATGLPGTPGAAGATGADSTVPGPAGATGTPGVDGATGLPGTPGTAGATGADSTVPGPAGATGTPGVDGATGLPGTPGAAGATGADSTVPGPAGATGADSTVPGPAGATGTPGVDGATGADSVVPGPAGATGTPGVDGATGLPGTPGAAGATGADSTVPGPAGATGTPGVDGATGLPGTPGAAGATGATGSTSLATRTISGTLGANPNTTVVLNAIGLQSDLNNVTVTFTGNNTFTISNVVNLKLTGMNTYYDAGVNTSTDLYILYPEINGATTLATSSFPSFYYFNAVGVIQGLTNITIANSSGIMSLHRASIVGSASIYSHIQF